jgi:DNA polymerase III subunit epsilon
VVSFGVVPVSRGRVILGESVYPLALARPDLRAALAGRYVLAWAAEVEATFLSTVFGRRPARWLRRIVDVLPLAVLADRLDRRVGRSGDYALAVAAGRFGVPTERPHHALDDALTTAQLFLVLATKLSKHGYGTTRRLLKASASPTA